MPSSATAAPTAISRGTSRIRIFATSVSVTASATQRSGERDRQQRELPPGAVRMRQEDLGGEHEHEPVPRSERPLEQGQVAAGVLEHGPFVDHRQLEVRVGVVDRLPSRLGDHDEREGDGAERRAPGSSRRGRRPCPRRSRAGRSCRRRAPRPRARARAPPRRTPTASGRGSLPGARSRWRRPRPPRRPRTGRARAGRPARARRGRRPSPGAASATGTSRIAAPSAAATSSGASR